jgi:hypothetical protein
MDHQNPARNLFHIPFSGKTPFKGADKCICCIFNLKRKSGFCGIILGFEIFWQLQTPMGRQAPWR